MSLWRTVLVGLLLGFAGLAVAPSAGAEPVRDLSGLPADLQKYVPGSSAWAASPWMTSTTCRDRGGDFSIWTADVIRDTPSFLGLFQASRFGPEAAPADRARSAAIIGGYRSLAADLTPTIPPGYCVDDLRRWAGSDPSMRPFGFPWGVTSGHQTSYYCTDREPNATDESERNRWVGAERAMCDGFYVSCVGAPEVDKNRCDTWNAFSDSYVRRVELLRAKAINDYPASGQADTDTELKSPGEIVQYATGGWFQDLAASLARAAANMMAEAMTFWIRADQSSMISTPAVAEVQGLLRYVGIVLLVAGVMWQGILMVYRRKVDPLVSTGMGLLSFVGWSTLGGTLAVLLDNAGSALADQVLDDRIDRFSVSMGQAMQANVGIATGAVFLLSIVVFFLACIQWLLGFFRMGALVILLALIPTAASGQLIEGTKPWLRKVLSWCLALLLYKPVAAIVFAIGFTLMSDGNDLSTVLVGMAVLALAVVAMPTMLRFFDWGGQRFVASGGGGGAMAVGAAASLVGGTGVTTIGRFMDRNGPASGSSGGTSSGAVPVAAAHAGDGPSGTGAGGQLGASGGTAGQAGTATAAGGGGASATAGGAAAGGAGSGGAAGGAAGGGAAAGGAAGGIAGAAVAGAQAVKEGAGAAAAAASGAMTDGAPDGGVS